jgi:uncharacterized membrane protein
MTTMDATRTLASMPNSSAVDSDVVQDSHPESEAAPVIDVVVVACRRQELYDFWRDFKNMPKFVEKVARVTEVDSLSSLWTIRTPEGGTTEWEFMVTDDEPGRMICWSTSGHTPVKFSARVEFKDASPGLSTEVIVSVQDASAVPLQTGNDLLRFKQLMESRPR